MEGLILSSVLPPDGLIKPCKGDYKRLFCTHKVNRLCRLANNCSGIIPILFEDNILLVNREKKEFPIVNSSINSFRCSL